MNGGCCSERVLHPRVGRFDRVRPAVDADRAQLARRQRGEQCGIVDDDRRRRHEPAARFAIAFEDAVAARHLRAADRGRHQRQHDVAAVRNRLAQVHRARTADRDDGAAALLVDERARRIDDRARLCGCTPSSDAARHRAAHQCRSRRASAACEQRDGAGQTAARRRRHSAARTGFGGTRSADR